jgi:hypothetical protein
MEAMINPSRNEELHDFIGTGDNLGLPEKLAYLVTYGALFVTVICEKKDKPSALIKHLDATLGSYNPISTVTAQETHPDQILSVLARDFGLDQNRSLSIQNLASYSKNLHSLGRKPVLIVREAHKIKDRVLKAIFSIAERCELGLLIFARPSFKKNKIYKDFKSNIYVCAFSKMNDLDLKSYLRRRSVGDLEVSNAELDNILQRSEGSVSEIDRLMEDMLSSPKRKLGIPMMHMSVFAVMLVMGIIYYGQGQNYQSDEMRPSESLALDIPPISSLSKNSSPKSSAEQQPQTPDQSVERVTLGIENDTPAQEVEVVAKGQARPLSSAFIEPASIVPSEIVNLQENVVAVKVNTFVPPISPSANKWIMEASLTDYTLQVMGSSSEEMVKEFILGQANGEPFTYYETTRQNQSWFVLTVGQYQNRDDALAAIADLPPNIRSQLPWARNVASIRSTLVAR